MREEGRRWFLWGVDNVMEGDPILEKEKRGASNV